MANGQTQPRRAITPLEALLSASPPDPGPFRSGRDIAPQQMGRAVNLLSQFLLPQTPTDLLIEGLLTTVPPAAIVKRAKRGATLLREARQEFRDFLPGSARRGLGKLPDKTRSPVFTVGPFIQVHGNPGDAVGTVRRRAEVIAQTRARDFDHKFVEPVQFEGFVEFGRLFGEPRPMNFIPSSPMSQTQRQQFQEALVQTLNAMVRREARVQGAFRSDPLKSLLFSSPPPKPRTPGPRRPTR